MPSVSVIARIPVRPAKRAEFLAILNRAVTAAEHEQGTKHYLLHYDAKDENVIWAYEMCDDQADLDAHMSSDVLKDLLAAMPSCIDGRPELTLVTPIGGKGLRPLV